MASGVGKTGAAILVTKNAWIHPLFWSSGTAPKLRLFKKGGKVPFAGTPVMFKALRIDWSQNPETSVHTAAPFQLQLAQGYLQGKQLCLKGKYPGRHLWQKVIFWASGAAHWPQLGIGQPVIAPQEPVKLTVLNSWPSLQAVQFLGVTAQVEHMKDHIRNTGHCHQVEQGKHKQYRRVFHRSPWRQAEHPWGQVGQKILLTRKLPAWHVSMWSMWSRLYSWRGTVSMLLPWDREAQVRLSWTFLWLINYLAWI